MLMRDTFQKRSDIYSYFVTHATEFLADGGKLSYITSDRWLDTNYGADLQQFMLEQYCIDAVIRFDRQAFDDALVGSTIFVLTKEPNSELRDENVTKFLRVRRGMDVEEIAGLVEEEWDANQLVKNEQYRLVTQPQHALKNQDKWNRYFIAPTLYLNWKRLPIQPDSGKSQTSVTVSKAVLTSSLSAGPKR
ncbi:Eco57I restriction-modification methylase domain-containing protein [Halorussus caseinilyticus]|uniref:site-specific DNA-methyltransferase (adenine-specific) n=1 Tax=Halorussus caseinilyticus TaxID=3034025 RepID=A0ABD5WHW2_9EURY